jgi:hypothetical protein
MRVHHSIYLLIVLIMLAPISAEAQRRASDLVDPAPITIPAGVSQAAAKEAVVNAVLARGWTVAEESADQIVADLHVRAHWAQVGIDIEEEAVLISYRNSENLRYTERSDGRIVIHSNYLAWVDNLVSDIRIHLARAQREARG